jgi:hypothetical protein
VKAVSGGILAFKGHLLKGGGGLISSKGHIISSSGKVISNLGKSLASSAIIQPLHRYSSYGYPEKAIELPHIVGKKVINLFRYLFCNLLWFQLFYLLYSMQNYFNK